MQLGIISKVFPTCHRASVARANWNKYTSWLLVTYRAWAVKSPIWKMLVWNASKAFKQWGATVNLAQIWIDGILPAEQNMFWAELVLTGKKQELTGNRKKQPREGKTPGKEKHQAGNRKHQTGKGKPEGRKSNKQGRKNTIPPFLTLMNLI